MSDLGLYSGWYAQLREYSGLVDDVLLDSLQASPGTEPSRNRLANLFECLGGAHNADRSTTVLRLWIARRLKFSSQEWQWLANAVLAASADPKVINRLEEVARELELRRAQLFHEMRGR